MAHSLLLRAATAAALLLLAAPAAQAAYPDKAASYTVHDHGTKGKNWHVEVEISKERRLLAKTIVIYVQECNATPFAENERIDLKGRINFIDREFDLPKGAKGTWTVRAQWISTHTLKGVYRIVTPGCDTGARPFEAHAGGHEHSHHHAGTRPGEFPALASASSSARSQVTELWRNTLRAAADLFPTYESAEALKFSRYPLKWKRPLLFHLRRDGYAKDKVVLDPTRPESLVYWWPKRGAPVLVGFMYRAPLGKPPAFGGKLLAWHSHTENGHQGDNQMTHVWLTGDVRSALANCLPVDQLQKRIKAFRYSRPSHGAGHESRRCRT
jgi:hypothetical protein